MARSMILTRGSSAGGMRSRQANQAPRRFTFCAASRISSPVRGAKSDALRSSDRGRGAAMSWGGGDGETGGAARGGGGDGALGAGGVVMRENQRRSQSEKLIRDTSRRAGPT